MEPRLLLLDEPASSLDPGNARLLEENLERLSSQGMALMVATHDLDFAWRWAGRVLVFHGDAWNGTERRRKCSGTRSCSAGAALPSRY